jgi:hypothetical protein
MKKREVAFLLIGLGIGLILSVVAIVEFVMWFHHMFIVDVKWHPASALLAVPFLLVLIGSMLLFGSEGKHHSN